ncbi:MAG: NYN domain-containing protein [Sedimentisphaerales bacterium]|nr:NYN domain-containing protein [Sedimentisphaerales bacterium]
MPFLLDGYNVYHAARKLSADWHFLTVRQLAGLVAEDMRHRRDRGVIVFDGRRPRGQSDRVEPAGYVELVYCGPGQDADTLLEQWIRRHTAPRRLTVVSSDRRVRQAARRRRCRMLKADDYLASLMRNRQTPPPRPVEPPEKRHGLDQAGRQEWLELFGLSDVAFKAKDDPLGLEETG